MAHHHGNHDPATDLADAKRAMLDVGDGERNAPPTPSRVGHGASTLVRSYPIATLAGAAALGVIVVTQPWLRRVVVGVLRKTATAALTRVTS